MDLVKTCSKCGEDKPVDAFHSKRGQCKACRAAYNKVREIEKPRQRSKGQPMHDAWRAYRESNPEKVRAAQKAWAISNPDKVRAKYKAWALRNAEKLRSCGIQKKERYRSTLADSYIKTLIANNIPINRKDIPQALIDLKREQVATLREVKRLIEALKEIQND